MEQIDLNQIKLEDTGIFKNENHSFCSAFSKNKITTVGQVLDDNLMSEIIQRCKTQTRKELKGFIALLKYKYLEIPLSNNDILEQCYFYPVDFASLGLNKIYQKEMEWEVKKAHKEKLENKSLIDFIKERIYTTTITYPILLEILRLHIESYEKSKQLPQPTITQEAQPEDKTPSQQEHDILVILKDQLVKLVGVRDSLDAQIEDLQQKIDALTTSKTEGGVSKWTKI